MKLILRSFAFPPLFPRWLRLNFPCSVRARGKHAAQTCVRMRAIMQVRLLIGTRRQAKYGRVIRLAIWACGRRERCWLSVPLERSEIKAEQKMTNSINSSWDLGNNSVVLITPLVKGISVPGGAHHCPKRVRRRRRRITLRRSSWGDRNTVCKKGGGGRCCDSAVRGGDDAPGRKGLSVKGTRQGRRKERFRRNEGRAEIQDEENKYNSSWDKSRRRLIVTESSLRAITPAITANLKDRRNRKIIRNSFLYKLHLKYTFVSVALAEQSVAYFKTKEGKKGVNIQRGKYIYI